MHVVHPRNSGHARSQGGRQPAAAKPPCYSLHFARLVPCGMQVLLKGTDCTGMCACAHALPYILTICPAFFVGVRLLLADTDYTGMCACAHALPYFLTICPAFFVGGATFTRRYRLYRDACMTFEGNYLKDLNVLGRDLSKVAIVDNSPYAYGFQVGRSGRLGRRRNVDFFCKARELSCHSVSQIT